MSKKSFELPWWAAILVGITIISIGIIIGYFTDLLSPVSLTISIGLVLLGSLIGALVARLTIDQKANDLYQKNLFTVERSLDLLKEILEEYNHSLITYDLLKEIESSSRENSEIWILTTTLNLEEKELKDIVYANLQKGVTYKYLLPKEDNIIRSKMTMLANKWRKECKFSIEQAEKQIQCFLVPKHFAYMTVLIYDPFQDNPTVLIKFPATELYDRETYSLIFKVDSKPKAACARYVEALQDLMITDESRACQSAFRLDLFHKVETERKK